MSADMLFPGTVIFMGNKEQDNERSFLSLVAYHNLKPWLHLRCMSKLQAKIYCLLIRNNYFDEILNLFLLIDISSDIWVMFK